MADPQRVYGVASGINLSTDLKVEMIDDLLADVRPTFLAAAAEGRTAAALLEVGRDDLRHAAAAKRMNEADWLAHLTRGMIAFLNAERSRVLDHA